MIFVEILLLCSRINHFFSALSGLCLNETKYVALGSAKYHFLQDISLNILQRRSLSRLYCAARQLQIWALDNKEMKQKEYFRDILADIMMI